MGKYIGKNLWAAQSQDENLQYEKPSIRIGVSCKSGCSIFNKECRVLNRLLNSSIEFSGAVSQLGAMHAIAVQQCSIIGSNQEVRRQYSTSSPLVKCSPKSTVTGRKEPNVGTAEISEDPDLE